MNDHSELKNRLTTIRPVAWEQLPDINVYIDQLIEYMPRQLIDLSIDDGLTSSMIHNYSKDGVLPRSNGKKYSKDHIAYLTAICMLKQVLQVKELKMLLSEAGSIGNTRTLYELLGELSNRELNSAAEFVPESTDREETVKAALRLAVSAYARQLACRELLRSLEPEKPADPAKDKQRKDAQSK